MGPFIRVATVCSVLLAGFVWAGCRFGPHLVDLLTEPVQEVERGADLGHEIEATRCCLALKGEAVAELIQGHLTLLETAVRFEKAQEGTRAHEEARRILYPCGDPLERRCQEVLAHVAAALRDDRARAAVVLPRLEAQLQDYLRAYESEL